MTLKADMHQALKEEAFQDVTLVGTDHVDLPATKVVLAIRSPIFKRMFFGNFRERDGDRVSLNYPSLVLQVLVKYCYSDELDLDMLYSDNADEGLTDEEAVLMVQLRDAANYFELPDLNVSISNEIGETISQKGEILCVCAVLSELFARGETEGPMWTIMMSILEEEPSKCLLPVSDWNKGIVACCLPLFCKVMASSVIDPFVAVQSIQKWSLANPDLFHSTELTEGQTKLQQIADLIKLDAISPAKLAQIKPCQVFPMERLYQAFVENGIKQGVDGISLSPTESLHTRHLIAHVQGSGVPSANGTYAHSGGDIRRYAKTGVYGEISSTFELSWQEQNHKWELRVIPMNTPGEQFVLYESSVTTKEEVPFALWHCRDGKNPIPYVAIRTAALRSPNVSHFFAVGSQNPPQGSPPKLSRRRRRHG